MTSGVMRGISAAFISPRVAYIATTSILEFLRPYFFIAALIRAPEPKYFRRYFLLNIDRNINNHSKQLAAYVLSKLPGNSSPLSGEVLQLPGAVFVSEA